MAAFAAIVRAKEVLPTPGRAAKIIRSEFWRPFVSSSSSAMPVRMPVIPSLRLFRRSRSGVTKLWIGLRESLIWSSAIAKMSRSAPCNTSPGSAAGSMAFLIIVEDDLISLRRVAFLRNSSICHSVFAEDATDSISSNRYSRPPTSASLFMVSSSEAKVTKSIGVTLRLSVQRAVHISWCFSR